jgi:acyl-CoA synthetase (NDP forming)
MGGSWGVALSDSMEEEGLVIPELSLKLQKKLRDLGIPQRASMRNPVDIGASGMLFEVDTMLAIGREVLSSGEVDALVLHGLGRAGMLEEDSPSERRLFVDIEKRIIREFASLEKGTGLPVLIGSKHTLWESQVVCDLNREGIRIHNRLDEIAQLLSLMYDYWMKSQDN